MQLRTGRKEKPLKMKQIKMDEKSNIKQKKRRKDYVRKQKKYIEEMSERE